MKLKVVSLKLAKRLKDVGFDLLTLMYWHPDYGICDDGGNYFERRESDRQQANKFDGWADGYYSAPTLALAQEWLMLNHNIFVTIEIDRTLEPKYCYSIFIYDPTNETPYHFPLSAPRSDLYLTKNAALEDGILDAIKSIKHVQ